MAAKRKAFVKLQCEVCKTLGYRVHKSKKKAEEKLAMSKFCSSCRKHTAHKETKK